MPYTIYEKAGSDAAVAAALAALPPGGDSLPANAAGVLTNDGSGVLSWEAIPAGSGSSTITADDTPAVPAEGESASYFVTSAVSWPAGLVWSTDPDGGVAPTITGTALVSLFTVGGTTRAILGATFPAVAAPADTTAPAWSATFTMGTPTQSSVVATASALATDNVGVTGYEVSYNGGSSWAATAPSGSNFTLAGTAGTTYATTQLRAKDAAGNYSTALSVPSYTMASSTDATPPTVGTMAASAITTSGFTLTVSGAGDAGSGLHALPYAFDDGAGTFGAWQASATLAVTGKTAGTAYTCLHKVRDADGNESTGAAITVTTSASVTGLSAAIAALSPVGYWKLDETTGTIATDSSGNGRHGTYTGDVTLAASGGFPTFGATGYVDCGDHDAFSYVGATSGFTVFALATRPAIPDVNAPPAVIVGKRGSGQAEWMAFVTGAAENIRGKQSFAAYNLGGTQVVTERRSTSRIAAISSWAGYAFAADATAAAAPISLYRNSGTPVAMGAAEGTSTGWANGTSTLRIGAIQFMPAPPSQGPWAGSIGHVAIFAAKLTDQQIGALMDAARAEGLIP